MGHESLKKQTPKERWNADERPLRFPESVDDLRDKFVVTETRKVSPDHIISYKSEMYEVPRGLAGEWIDVQRRVLTGALLILHDGTLKRLHPVDLAANAMTQRARHKTDNDEPVLGPRGRITSQNWSVEAPVRQGATTKDWQRQFKEEQRRRTGWIDVPKWEVIVPRGLKR